MTPKGKLVNLVFEIEYYKGTPEEIAEEVRKYLFENGQRLKLPDNLIMVSLHSTERIRKPKLTQTKADTAPVESIESKLEDRSAKNREAFREEYKCKYDCGFVAKKHFGQTNHEKACKKKNV